MSVYLVRHTEVDVPKGICYGRTDVGLKAGFEAEAEQVSNRLSGILFERVYTSPLSRCTRLADYCGFPHAIRDDRLMELNFGDWEMQSFDRITDPRLLEWYEDYLHVRPTGGESFLDLLHRVSGFLDQLRNETSEESNSLVFTHGGVQLCALIHAEKRPPEDAFRLVKPPPYGSIVKVY